MATLAHTALSGGALNANGSQFRPTREGTHGRILGRLLFSPCPQFPTGLEPITSLWKFKLHHYPAERCRTQRPNFCYAFPALPLGHFTRVSDTDIT